MTRTKGASVKKQVMESDESVPKKQDERIQSPFDLEEEALPGEETEKDTESPFGGDEDGDLGTGDELSLDSEELDPFGDKWEE